jgi:hypothetical protein
VLSISRDSTNFESLSLKLVCFAANDRREARHSSDSPYKSLSGGGEGALLLYPFSGKMAKWPSFAPPKLFEMYVLPISLMGSRLYARNHA